jgi:N-acyl-D-amino-acid deacylase
MKSNISRRDFLIQTSIISTGLFLGCYVKNQFDLIVKNGSIIDGSGNKTFKADLGIIGNQIKAIGDLNSSSADKVIDAKNMFVSPGFIDIHTHTEIELLVNSKAESKIRQGVTTEVGGNCGSSPYPLNGKDFDNYQKRIKERYDVNVDWKNIDGFFTSLERNKIALNFASFTGHSDLRAFAVGRYDEKPTPEQMELMKELLAKSMEYGSFGLSTGLEYTPGSYADTDELIELSKTAAEFGGIYNTHMRNEDDTVEEAIQEALEICEKANIPLEIAHLKIANPNNWHKIDRVLEMLGKARDKGLPVTADRYPYNAYATGLSTFLPQWARQGDTDEIVKRLQNKSQLPKIKEYAESRGSRIGGWDNVTISSVSKEGNKKFEGMSIKDGAKEESVEPFEFIRNLLIEERTGGGIVGFAMKEENLKKILKQDYVMIGSDGSATAPYGKLGSGKPHPRFYGSFPRVLGKYARDEKLFSFETAVKKMTSMPAEKMGIKKRGYLKKNYFADVVIFNPETVIDGATFVKPKQYPKGIDYVIVNGEIVINKGNHTNKLPGNVLRHS